MFHTPSGSCIDIVLTNNPKNFHDTGEIEAGVNDHDLHISFLKKLVRFLRTQNLLIRSHTGYVCKT